MHPAAMILDRLCLVLARSDGERWHYRTLTARRIGGKTTLNEEAGRGRFPAVLILSGAGILVREYAPEDPALQRIVSRPEEFLFALEDSGGGKRLTFMRRQSYEEALAGIRERKIAVIGVRIDPADAPEAEALAAAREFFDKTLTARKLVKTSPENDTLFSLMAGRLLWPVLGAMFLVLAVNFFVRKGLEKEYGSQSLLLDGLRQSAAVREREEGGQRRLQELLLPVAAYPYAWIADRIAASVPEGVVLTGLTVHPLQAKLQADKPAAVDAGRVVIRGEAVEAAPVSRLTDTLGRMEFCRAVQLLSLTRGRQGEYVFEIDLRF